MGTWVVGAYYERVVRCLQDGAASFLCSMCCCGVVYVPSAGRRRISSKWEAFASSIAWDCRTTCPIMALRESTCLWQRGVPGAPEAQADPLEGSSMPHILVADHGGRPGEPGGR